MRLPSLSQRLPSGLHVPRLWAGIREFFAYHGVWAVGVRLLRKLSIRDKILIVLALLATPLLPLTVAEVARQTAAVGEAERHLLGVRLIGAMHRVSDSLQAGVAALERGSQPDWRELEQRVEGLRAAHAQAEASGLAVAAGWEAVEPALGRLSASAAVSGTGRVLAMEQARLDLSRLLEAVVQASGFMLTRDREVLAYAASAYIYGPQVGDELWLLTRAIRAHVAVQDRMREDEPRIAPTILAVAGHVEVFDQVVRRMSAIVNGQALGDETGPVDRELKLLKTLSVLVKSAFLKDGYLSADELVAIRTTQEGALSELAAMRDIQLHWLGQHYLTQRDRAVASRRWVVGGTLASVVLAFYLFYAFYLVMRGGLNTLNDQMRRMATGDLSMRSRPLGGDEVAVTMRAVSVSVERLGELLAQVRHGSSSVSQAAQQIATGNGDLRTRNHRTSDSLQKVVDGVARYSAQLEACSQQVERVVATVQQLRLQSARSRRQMDHLRETLHTVRRHSQQITEAVSLIDNVAFRTTILALNASVEASKAGEAGRGFAVVAQEVRTLATRSAEAARRIGSIVTASGDDVAQSAQLAEDTGRAIAESDGHIDLIHGAMGDVSALTRDGQQESAAILEQVRALRETTEKNLGLVEQLANASHSLRSHGERLTQRLTHFKLG